jgi:hypothetical protein
VYRKNSGFTFSSTAMCAPFWGGSVDITDKIDVKNKGNQKGQSPSYYRSLGRILQIVSREIVPSNRFLIHK